LSETCPALPHFQSLPFRHDRNAAWHQLQGAGDVSLSEDGVYFLTNADQVEAAAKNPQVFSSQDAFGVVGSPFPLVPIEFDPPEHSRYRRMLDKFFSPRSMAERDPELRKQAGELIDALHASGDTCDIVSALAVPFPSQVFLSLFGLPLEDTERLIGWKNAMLELADLSSGVPTPETLDLAAGMHSYITDHMAERRGGQGSDLLSLLLADRDEGGLTDEEIVGLCFLFLVAGLDTVTSAIGFSLTALAQDRDRRLRITEDPSLIPEFIEEVLRVDSPISFVPRVTTQDIEVGGVTIPAGSTCMLSFGAANRDDRRYQDVETIHDTRSNHFAFGRGPHRCLGSHLARLELRIVLEEWHKRIPNYALANGVPVVRWPGATFTLERVDLTLR
jgi:cytochrome P450